MTPIQVDAGRRVRAVVVFSLITGVVIYSIRTQVVYVPDGEIPILGVLLGGMVLVVLPLTVMSFALVGKNASLSTPVGVIDVGSGLLTALMPVGGSLYMLSFVAVFLVSSSLLCMVAGLSIVVKRHKSERGQ